MDKIITGQKSDLFLLPPLLKESPYLRRQHQGLPFLRHRKYAPENGAQA